MPGCPFGYQWEKLANARRCLMLPHWRGEEEDIAAAFADCQLAFHEFDEGRVEYEPAREWIRKIKGFMDTAGLQDTTGQGLWLEKALRMTNDQRSEFSSCVDELAHWFAREQYS